MKAYRQSNIPLAKQLRKNMTLWERKLWYEYLRYYPVRFQRQKAIGDYIVDFYCAKAGLVIELDGGGHYSEEQQNADARRTACLEKMNLRVLRICNLDVDANFRGVCEYIDLEVQKSLPQSASLTAPSSEGASRRPNKAGKVFALGFFDGVHLGHQALLRACRAMAKELDCETAAITFERHPQSLFSNSIPPLITTLEDRIRLLKRHGADHVCAFPVTAEVMGTPWQDFLNALLDRGAAGFVCGDDFRFGCKGEGTAHLLKAYCEERELPCVIVEAQTVDGVRISSSHIRSLLEAGETEEANRFLGHPHVLSGTVVPGRQLGRTIGIPTANLALPEGVLAPKFGVYACLACFYGEKHMAVTNVGMRPTVGGRHITVEPWILDFDGDLYGQTVTLEFHAFLRPERKFDSLEQLKEAIEENARQTREYFRT